MPVPTISFPPMPKIPRFFREIIITEKIDGTNASVYIPPEGDVCFAASRSKWIEPGKQDNFGFAGWVQTNEKELLRLGPGHHFGEWWGKGIQRGYGLDHKRFSLFNTYRWSEDSVRPACCHVIPILYQGPMDEMSIEEALADLDDNGSIAAPDWDGQPEGVCVYHVAANMMFKVTIEDDDTPKSILQAVMAGA